MQDYSTSNDVNYTGSQTQSPSYGEVRESQSIQTNSTGGSTMKKKLVVIMVITFLFIISCIVSASVGAFFGYRKKESIEQEQEESSTEEAGDLSEDANGGSEGDDVDDSDDGDQSDDGDGNVDGDGEGEFDDDGDGNVLEQPEFTEIIENMSEVESYRMAVDMTSEGQEITMEAFYQAPDKEYMKVNMNGITIEEIVIGDTLYMKEGDGEWELTEDSGFTGFSSEMTTTFGDDFDSITKLGESSGKWLYEAVMDGGTGKVKVYVSKDKKLFTDMVVYENGEKVGVLEFDMYNSEEIEIEAPI